jgi:hypothetical protein
MSRKKIKNPPKKKHKQAAGILGVGWYKASEWDRLREISVDRDELEETHEEWLNAALKAETHLKKVGLEYKRVDVDVEALWAWCEKEGRAVDGPARSEFVSVTLRDKSD